LAKKGKHFGQRLSGALPGFRSFDVISPGRTGVTLGFVASQRVIELSVVVDRTYLICGRHDYRARVQYRQDGLKKAPAMTGAFNFRTRAGS
jgi:hypothetical protein